jgi:tetratricopeptide (TPR) repeat protein
MTARLWLGAVSFCTLFIAKPGFCASAPVILISVDTLRADRLGCYGAGAAHTPNIDSLAKKGTLFSQISAQVPLTLPSHASLLTSTYPFSNGVIDNGQQLSSKVTTLATLLKACGYRTAGFVGGFVMDRRFGLDQGFDVYDSPFDLHRRAGIDPGDVKRPGTDVAAGAMSWLEQNSAVPFFLFLHLYDLHTPRTRSYDGELEYVDGVLGNFLGFLARKNLLGKSLVVFTSDHGEGLGDHEETTHGYFIYQSTLHVPLIIHWPPGGAPLKDRVDQAASLLDVTPTILEALGVPVPPGMHGHSLKNPAGEVYAESHYAERHFGCSALRTLRAGRYKYIEAPRPELYDLAADPGERNNLYDTKKSDANSMRQRLITLRNRFPTARTSGSAALTPEATAALRSLGYLAGGSAPLRSSSNSPDPKDRIADFEQYGRVLALASSGDLAKADRELVALMNKLPDAPDVRVSLGLNQQKLGRHAEAVETFRGVLRMDPANALAHFDLAVSLFQLARVDEAAAEVHAALAISPSYARAHELEGNIYVQKKDYAGARRAFERLLTIDAANYEAHYNLGILAALDRNWGDAASHLRAALRTDPNSADAYNALGSGALQRGDLATAADAFREAIRLRPKFAWAHYNLGLVFRKQQKSNEAAREFHKALDSDPKFTPAQTALERLEGNPP